MKKPKVFRKDIIVKLPTTQVKLGSEELSTEVEAIIAFKGEDVVDFKIGDSVLINKNKATEIKFFSEKYWKTYESYVICGIVEDDSI